MARFYARPGTAPADRIGTDRVNAVNVYSIRASERESYV
jgi:hypothetical protein